MLDARISEIDTRVSELLALRTTLAETRRDADNCTPGTPATVCAIIEKPVTAAVSLGTARCRPSR